MIIRNYQSNAPYLEAADNDTAAEPNPADYTIVDAGDLLRLYVATDDNAPLMPLLRELRAPFIDDLDQVGDAAQVTGLMYWLMADYGVDNRGETLEETADRLGDLDIEADTDRYTDLIFHLKDAAERLYDLELE